MTYYQIKSSRINMGGSVGEWGKGIEALSWLAAARQSQGGYGKAYNGYPDRSTDHKASVTRFFQGQLPHPAA